MNRRESSRPSAGLIGFGRLGELLVHHFSRDAGWRVYDPRPRTRAMRALGAVPCGFDEACRQDLVVLCVPIGRLEGVVCKARIGGDRYRKVRRVLEAKGLRVVEMTPREHDRRMASSLVLTHFIGRGLLEFGARTTDVDTEGYRRLLRILQTVQNDSWELFRDMNRFNTFAPRMRRRFLGALRSVDARLTAGHPAAKSLCLPDPMSSSRTRREGR